MEHQQIEVNWTVHQQFRNLAGQVYCTVYLDLENNIITDVWTGAFGKQENFQEVLISVVEAIKKHKLSKWLANLTDMQGGFKGSEKWLQEHIMPQAEQFGIRYEAVILSKDIYAKLSTADSVKKINEIASQGSIKLGKIELRQFTDYHTAFSWLQSK